MKKILLIGDSIRMGYDVLVKEAFRDKAEVYFTYDNNRFAEYILRYLHEWKESLSCGDDVDCVHWNVGLWDSLVLFEDGTLTPVDVYESYMERICQRIKLLFPTAKVIFATSTPVDEARFTSPEKFVRYNSDIEEFNKAAIRAVKKYGHEINDLYGLMKDQPKEYHSDVTHYYSKNGATLLADRVCEVIGKSMNIMPESIDYGKWFDKSESYDGNEWLKKRYDGINDTGVLGV